MRGVASPVRRGGVLRGLAVGRAAGSTVPQQGQARAGRPWAARRSSPGQGGPAPAPAGPCAAAVARGPGLPGRAASGGPGDVRGGGGSRSAGGPGPGVGLQPPNKGLQATGNSLRSSLASAGRRG